MLIDAPSQHGNTVINMEGVNVKTDLASRKLTKKETKKAATAARKAELVAAR